MNRPAPAVITHVTNAAIAIDATPFWYIPFYYRIITWTLDQIPSNVKRSIC
jgi:hypothetical protein